MCSDPSAPAAAAALARERIALRVDDPPADRTALADLFDELTDRYRGECVAVVLPADRLAHLDPELTRSGPDRDVTVVH